MRWWPDSGNPRSLGMQATSVARGSHGISPATTRNNADHDGVFTNVRLRPLFALAALSLVAGCSPATTPSTRPTSPSDSVGDGSVRPSGSPAGTAAPLPATPVPAGFIVEDLSFAGARDFALGTAHGTLMLAGSDDSGRTWRLIGDVPQGACPVQTRPCVSRIRFGSANAGYAFAPGLLTTTDGGAHWTMQAVAPLRGSVLDLAAYGPQAAIEAFGSAPCGCTLRYTTDSADHWHATGVSPTSGSNSSDKVLMQAGIAYATQLGNTAGGGDGGAAVYVSLDGGMTWSTRAVPCGQNPLTGDIDATSGNIVAVLCIDRTVQPYDVSLRISGDGGHTFGPAGEPVPGGGEYSIALAVAGRASAAIATHSGVVLTNDSGQHWRSVLACAASWLGFESATEAHAVCAGGKTIWRSSDGGPSWQSFTFS